MREILVPSPRVGFWTSPCTARTLQSRMLVEMKVSSLTVDPFTNMPIVVLKDHEGRQAVPIWIGLVEASAIATELEQIALDRPMTHDLLKTILGQCGVGVDRVEVTDLRENTFYATIHLRRPDGKILPIDSRPSDAIALALRTGAPIRVAKKVIDKARRIDLRIPDSPGASRIDLHAATGPADDMPQPKNGDPVLADLLERLSDTAFGKWKM